MTVLRKIAAGACAVLAVAGVSVAGAPAASAGGSGANRCVRVSVDYTRTGPVSWFVNSATVANNCNLTWGHFQLTGPTFNHSNGDAPVATGFTITLNENWGGTAPSVCGTAWFKVTPSFWAESGYACVTLV